MKYITDTNIVIKYFEAKLYEQRIKTYKNKEIKKLHYVMLVVL